MEDSRSEDEQNEHTNIDLIYNYTEYRLKLTKDSINVLNAKLGAVLAFSTISIIFLMNLPNQAYLTSPGSQYICYSCLILKVLACCFLSLTIYLSAQGFRPKPGGGMTPPNLLMNENYYDSEENCRLIITKTWIEALQDLEGLRDEKAKIADQAIQVLCVAAFCATGSVILASGLSML